MPVRIRCKLAVLLVVLGGGSLFAQSAPTPGNASGLADTTPAYLRSNLTPPPILDAAPGETPVPAAVTPSPAAPTLDLNLPDRVSPLAGLNQPTPPAMAAPSPERTITIRSANSPQGSVYRLPPDPVMPPGMAPTMTRSQMPLPVPVVSPTMVTTPTVRSMPVTRTPVMEPIQPSMPTRMAPQFGTVALQPTSPPPGTPRPPRSPEDVEELKFDLSLEIPGNDQLFRLEDEKRLQDRILEDFRQQGVVDPIDFPALPVLSTTQFAGRAFNRTVMTVEPNFVTYGRLYFEEKNSERYGWDLGPIQPLVSLAAFYKDVVFMPHNVASRPFSRWDTSAGYALPGDPIPYMIYPPQITITGTLALAGAVIGPAVIVP
ncbi:hypothetical protein [Tuwongella immobilis]|uniref:Signal peptide protein n=1 Tax=Tuwongella immobilis TaxID=692036 RepID=A0A6C2YME2_9BACT|nr:hypothetical protein [Tuwongella immobilis]VIP02389.1 Signal peptide protein OS=Rhodopirellula sp. SWK7 GN=RRSWK_05324 PE=4 SV=1 [Tuwongella immobilis]VTS01253.1 Signal peptide protein OS=Rhodopirellula sp. SWK7 GN=RRSWK_05324 PE=4 SV=1 [Tuwongella immobilis]